MKFVEASRAGVWEVLCKLMDNAIDAASAGKVREIAIVVKTDVDSGIANIGIAKFTVMDSGSGVPVEIEDKVFTPFFTTKEVGSGVGLGLSISYGIIRNDGGAIYVDRSSDGKSAISFTVGKKVA